MMGHACRICDRKLFHKKLISVEMEDVEFLNQWEIDEEENQLVGAKKEITIAEEKLVAA